MERNKEIATSANLADSLTEQQCDVLEWASDMRHVMHKNSEALYDVNAPKHKEIKAFIMDVFGDKIPLYSLFIVQYNQGTSLGQLLQDVDLRQYNLQIPDKIIDEISDAVNYIRGYMGRE